MKKILAYIEQKKHEFSQLPFFEYLRDKSISPMQRLAFAPCAAPFVMTVGELNRSVFRVEPTDDPIQKIINKLSYEDDHHWVWFLEDLEKLNLNPVESYTKTLNFLWSEETRETRRLCHEMYRSTFGATPIQKMVIIEVIEATGNIAGEVLSKVTDDLLQNLNEKQEYRYFGTGHLMVEPGNSYNSLNDKQFVESIQISEDLKKESLDLVDYFFSIFSSFVNELLRYAMYHSKNEAIKTANKNSQGFKLLADQSVRDAESNIKYDYIVVGAGPAGLQLGYFLEKTGRKYLILEAGESPGTFFKKFPRHKKLISINKRYTGYDDPEINLRWDWNSLLSDSQEMRFTNYSKDYFPSTDRLVEYFNDFANHFNLNIKYNCKVDRILKDKEFTVTDSQGNLYTSSRLVIATGLSKAYLPEIPGIELTENYTDVSINPEDFTNQKVLIIGKGNSGFETADHLISEASLIHIVSPNPVSLAWKTKYVGHLRAVNNNFIDSYQLKSQNVVLDAFVDKIEYKNGQFFVTFKYTHADGELEEIIYDRVIVCTGFKFDTSIFDDSCRPMLTINDRFPRQTSEWESTNIKDMYFAGNLTHMRDFKKKQSGFIHGFRYNIKALHHILEHKYYGELLPYEAVNNSPEILTNHILKRVNVSSGLWQQTGFLCDLIVVPDVGQDIRYYKDMPIDYVHESDLGKNGHYYIITLEFGLDIILASPDPLAISRVHKDDVENADKSTAIHPIVRRFCSGKLISQHHVIEDLAGEWMEDIHILPLEKFLQNNLSTQNKPLGIYLLEAGLLNSEKLEIALNEQKVTTTRLGEILSNHGWMKQKTIEYVMEKVIHKRLSGNGQRLGSYLVESGLLSLDQIEIALREQKLSHLCLGEILASYDWVSQQTIDYIMEKVVLPERQMSISAVDKVAQKL